MSTTIVSLVKCKEENIKEAVFKAIEKTNFKPREVDSVIIKPNLCYYWGAATGETTDPRVVSAIIDYVWEYCSPNADIRIAEADASAMKTRYAFKMLGYTNLAAEKNVELFNLCDDDFKGIDVKTKSGILDIHLPRSIFDCDLFINVPKLKVPRRIPLTCAMKNLFGCIHDPQKAKYHSDLDEVIAGVNNAIKPDLTVVDGLVALGKYPIKLGLLIAGIDSVAVDSIAAKIIGYDNPDKIKYIRLAKRESSGGLHAEIVGEDINYYKKRFPKLNGFLFNLSWSLQLKMLKIYTKLTGDVIPPILGDNL